MDAEEPWFDVAGNRLRLLTDGPRRLDSLIALIDGAQRSLRLIFYIYSEDSAGDRVRAALVRAQQRGVDVSLIVDGFGSDASDAYFAPLAAIGADVCRFIPRFGRRYLLRNHQKLALADGDRAIVGGFNVASDYFGTADEQAWRDLGLVVEGPAARHLEGYFDTLSAWVKQPRARIRTLRHALDRSSQKRGRTRWLFGGPLRGLSPWAKRLREDMVRAHRVDMIAAYFAPNPGMLRRIEAIPLHREGQARVITAALSDNSATIGAARHNYDRLLRRGVAVFEYRPTKLHTKLYVVDDVTYIGSANFDMRSLYLNLEIMVRIEDPAFAARCRAYVEGEIADSRAITLGEHRASAGWLTRLRWRLAYYIVAVVDYNVSRRLNFGIDGR